MTTKNKDISDQDLEELLNKVIAETTSRRSDWGVERRIPVALIAAVIFQTMFFVWGAASLSTEVQHNTKVIAELEKRMEKNGAKMDLIKDRINTEFVAKQVKLEIKVQSIESRLDEIEDHISGHNH